MIAHVLHRLDRAGAEVLAAGLARALSDRYRFVFLCLDGLGPLAEGLAGDGFAVEPLDRRPGIDMALGRRLRERLRFHDVSLVHAHQYTPFFYSALSRGRLPTRKTPPILFTEHGRHYPDRRSTRRVLANKLLLRGKDRVSAVGRFVADALTRNEGIAARKIQVIYNGIAPGPEPTDADRLAAREKLGIAPDRPVAMQVARLHPVKDHQTAIDAWALVHQQLPEALLVLVGDGELRDEIEQKVAELGLKDAVQFTGPVDNARALIPAADLCMLTSLSEGVSVTLLEAMAACRPVVATDVGGNPEVVEHDKTGLLVPRRGVEPLAKVLVSLLSHTAYSQRKYGPPGRARLLEHFTADRMHGEYAGLYDHILGGK